MSLPLSHAGGSVDGISAALDLRFASSLSLTSTSGLTPSFSRASGGTFTGSDGLLKYTPLNTVLYSEQLDNVYWSRIASTISADSAVAPDGKTTADKLVETATTSTHRVYKETAGNINGAKYYWSFYAKASERSWVILDSSDATTNFLTWFNLSNGTIGTVDGARTASIQSVGNGWYRCSVYGNLITGTTVGIQAYTATGDGVSSFLGNSSAGLYIWGMQITRSESLGDYAQTTTAANSAPRFNHVYNGSSWVSKGLLIEEQRVNYVKYANDLSTNWANESGATREYNSIVSPDGGTNATKVNVAVSGFSGIYQFPLSNGGSGTYTYSIFAKKGTKDWLIILNAAGAGSSPTFFNISNGTIGTVFSGYSATISDVGNGWYRCILTTASSTTPSWFQIVFVDANNSITPASTGYSYVYGAQIELGSFATSFIPNNTASSVTRSADVCQITGGDFSGFYNQTEGSFAVNYDCPANGTLVQYQANSATSTNIHSAVSIGTTQYFQVYLPPEQALINAGSIAANVSQSLSSAYKINDFAASLNGSAVATDTAGSLPAPTKLIIGSDGSNCNNGHIARLRYFNKRLTNKQLEDLCKPEQQLKLDLNFSSSLSLTPTVGPTPSFSRASTGTYFNASGVLTSAAINAPRFDHVYDGTNWVSKGLLIEEQRTNSVINSNNINGTGWIRSNGSLISNSQTSPDGTVNASEYVGNNGAGYFEFYQQLSLASGIYTNSIFLKSSGTGADIVSMWGYSGNAPVGWFNLANGTSQSGTETGISYTATIKNCGNGWFRCSITNNTATTCMFIFPCRPMTAMGGTTSLSGNGVRSVYVYGAQLEAGAFPTSYIPTVASSVTRSADVCQITGSAFTNLWNASEGSFVLEYDRLAAITSGFSAGYPRYFTVDDGTTSNRMGLLGYTGSPSNEAFYAVVGGVSQGDTLIGASAAGGVFQKIGFGYKANDGAASLNGAAVVADATFSVPTVTNLQIGYYNQASQSPINGHIARLRYYSIRLPNRLLIAKST